MTEVSENAVEKTPEPEEQNVKEPTSKENSEIHPTNQKLNVEEPEKTVSQEEIKTEEKQEIQNSDVESDDHSVQLPDNRNIRRIIAEDPEYNLATVAELENRALNKIIENFAFNSKVYTQLKPNHKRKVLEKISLSIPLKVVANLVEDGIYWERKCKDRWSVCDISHYGQSWKRLFFEKNLEKIIEDFIPEKTDRTCLEDTLALSAPYVQRLNISQMLPPIKVEPKVVSKEQQDDASDAESDTDEAPKFDHLNLLPFILKLTNLTDLRVVYDVKNIGMNFEWNVFQFTVQDCQNLAECVAQTPNLKVFHLTRSRVDCDRCRLIISKLLNHPGLIELDLSYNHIGDRGTRAIGKLINNNCKLQILRLACNMLQGTGGQALGFAISKNSTLLELDIRMNRIKDEGGQSIAKSLLNNNTLTKINLAANELSEPTAAKMAQVFRKNTTLTSIDLSNNKLGLDGGKQLQEGMDRNRRLLCLDLRFTECGDEALFSISQIISFNQRMRMYSEETDPEIRDAAPIIIQELQKTIFSDPNLSAEATVLSMKSGQNKNKKENSKFQKSNTVAESETVQGSINDPDHHAANQNTEDG